MLGDLYNSVEEGSFSHLRIPLGFRHMCSGQAVGIALIQGDYGDVKSNGSDPIPSWDYEREPYQHYGRVEKCAVTPGGVDEFGAVSQGMLQVSGLVPTGVLEQETETRMGRDSATYRILFPSGMKLPVKADYLLDEPGDNQVLPGTEVKCLRMSWLRSGSWYIFVSLVLRLVSVAGVLGTLYERIGCIRIDAKATGGNSPSPTADPSGLVYSSEVEERVAIV